MAIARTDLSSTAATIERLVIRLRGQAVILDSDLARLYGVPTKALVQSIVRNRSRFPPDFMFQLTDVEFEFLRSQFVTSKGGGSGGRRYRPYAFTEHGVAMLSSVLRSKRAIVANIEIMRAFVRLRRLVMAQAELERKLNTLERKYDARFKVIFDAIRKLMAAPAARTRIIGFQPSPGRDEQPPSLRRGARSSSATETPHR
jgi:hypothetical protein